MASTFWAIGNLVQLGKGAEIILDDHSNSSSGRPDSGRNLNNLNLAVNFKPKKAKKNSTKFVENDLAAVTHKASIVIENVMFK